MRRDVQQIIDQADTLADYFESGFASDDPEDVAALRAAAHRRAVAEADVVEAVTAAIAAGRSWRMVGEALGTSGEAARQRYGKLVGERPSQPKNKEAAPSTGTAEARTRRKQVVKYRRAMNAHTRTARAEQAHTRRTATAVAGDKVRRSQPKND